jgi:hypothetical protein
MGGAASIGQLHGGGIVLGYRCPSRCRHCLYACGPHRRDGLPDVDGLDRMLGLLAERAPGARYHIGGGEPFLDVGLLAHAVEGMASRGLALDYVETNASWATSRGRAEELLGELAAVGLERVLVSVSPFHAEFVSPRRTRSCIAAAERILSGGAFVWIPEFFGDLRGCADGERLDLEGLLDAKGDRYAVSLAARYGLVPAGRAGRYLARHGQLHDWRELVERAPCPSRLRDTSHFHVDGDGLYVPGLCAGLVLPLEELPGPVDREAHPLVGELVEPGGLGRVVERAVESGFAAGEGFSAPCDLCTAVRLFLWERGERADLGPEGFYDPRSFVG